jgi:hypothetical protein
MVMAVNCTIMPRARTRKFTPSICDGRVAARVITHVKQVPKRGTPISRPRNYLEAWTTWGRTSDFEGQAPPANRISDPKARKPARFLRWSLDCRLHQASETGTGQGHREDSQRNPARRHQNYSGKQSTVLACHPRPAIRAEVLNTLRHRSYGFRVSPGLLHSGSEHRCVQAGQSPNVKKVFHT